MRFIFVYKGIYVGILLINFYLYHFVKGQTHLPISISWAPYYFLIILCQAIYFSWNAFNFSRILQNKVTRPILISEMIICVGKMVMPIAGAFFYHIISPSGYVYLAILHKIWTTFELYQYPLVAPVISFALVNLILEGFYFRCLIKNKNELASNLSPNPSPA